MFCVTSYTSSEQGGSSGSYYEYLKGKTHQPAIETGLADELLPVFQTHPETPYSDTLSAVIITMYKWGKQHRGRIIGKEVPASFASNSYYFSTRS